MVYTQGQGKLFSIDPASLGVGGGVGDAISFRQIQKARFMAPLFRV